MHDNLAAAILEAAAAAGNKPFLVEADAPPLLFGALERETGRLAAQLHALGGRPGDRIVVQVDKSRQAVLLYLAALRAGLVFVPLNTAYTTAELAYFIADAQPSIVVCRPADAEPLRAVAGTAQVVTLGANTLAANGEGTLLADLPGTSLPLVPRGGADLAAILYTSGTTGRSKGAMLTHGNLLSNALTLRQAWHWRADDVLIHILPIYHVHGLFVALHGSLLAGATTLFHSGFDPAAVIGQFDRATVLMGVPTHYTRLVADAALTPAVCAGMRLFVSGSAPLLAETHQTFQAKSGHPILERYGMTETGMITSNPYAGEGPTRGRIAGTVGYPLPGVAVRICDHDGAPVPTGEPGVLEVRGPNVFAGYWRNPEKTAQEFRADGWFITGDIATAAPDGRITLVGRAKDLIIAGGLNIYPKDIEDLIDAIPGVVESAVIGVPHRDLGEGVVAVVVSDPAAGVTETAVLEALAGQLARFKQPRRVILVDALPRNAMGKVQKAALRAKHGDLFAR